MAEMTEAGAEVIDSIVVPNLGDLMTGAGVINHEFKFDFIDYLAASSAEIPRKFGALRKRPSKVTSAVSSRR